MTWNPTIGCTRVSAGCEHCYAEKRAYRNAAMGNADYAGLTRKHADGSINWTGEVRMLAKRLEQPLRWKAPRRIFVDSMSDLFHESVSDAFIADVINIMVRCPQHTFQILTKRPERMQRLLSNLAHNSAILHIPFWPLPNVWLGVSVEDQAAADERIPLLLDTPAAVRFLSCEPLLGPLDLTTPWYRLSQGNIHWVIAGGESGPGGRWLVEPFRVEQDQAIDGQRTWWEPKPAAIDWVRSIRDQCQAADVPFFFKQWGGPTPKAGGRLLAGREWNEFPATDHGR